MQSLQTKKKFAISLGVTVAMVAISFTMMLSMVFSSDANSGLTPTNKSVPDNNVPEMIVSDDTSVSNKMPVPGNHVPEMIVSGNSISMIRNFPN